MQVTMEKPKASDLVAGDNPGLQKEIPHCVAATNGSWCDLDTGDENAGEEFEEEDFDDDFDDDFEEEDDDGYGDFDNTIDPLATDNDTKEEEDVELDE
jgi:hypothetical protein